MNGSGQRVFRPQMTLYGASSWNGPKYLEFFQRGIRRESVSELWLGHTSAHPSANSATALVGTFAPEGIITPPSFEERVVFSAAMRIVAMSLPDSTVEHPEGLHDRIADFVRHAAETRDQWQPITLSVNNADTVGRHWKFAHWEMAYVKPVEQYPFAILVNSPEILSSIDVAPLSDTNDYGFSVRDGFTAASMKPMFDPPGSFHEDYKKLLSDSE